MFKRRNFQGAAIILGLALCIYLGIPPSDNSLIRRFHADPAAQQLAALFEQDRQPLTVNASGDVLFRDENTPTLPPERLDWYRDLVRRTGASWVGGDGAGSLTLYYPPPVLLPGLSMKSLVYTSAPQTLLTDGTTDFYKFQPGQYQRVCRPIEANWYVCKDNED